MLLKFILKKLDLWGGPWPKYLIINVGDLFTVQSIGNLTIQDTKKGYMLWILAYLFCITWTLTFNEIFA